MPNPSQKVTTNVQTILHDIGYNRPTTVYESTSSQEVKSNNDISPELSYLYKSIIAAALFDCALKEVSPRVILKALQSCETTVNSENIKSHLQKYRCNSKCSRISFIHQWEKKRATIKTKPTNPSNHVVMV